MLPPGTTKRLFAEDPPGTLSCQTFQPYWLGRLMEEGEEADLRWLTAVVSEKELETWLDERGGRQLSRRSRAFWVCLLGSRGPLPNDDLSELWPL